MEPSTEHVQMIGPWGWIGYGIAALFGFMLWRVLNSSRANELRKMGDELKKARTTICELRKLEGTWNSEKETLTRQVKELQESERNLAQRVAVIQNARDLQNETIERMERNYKALQDKNDNLFARVMTLELRQGIDPTNSNG